MLGVKTKPRPQGHTTQALRLGGAALLHALDYARTRGCTLRLATEAILLQDKALDQVVQDTLQPVKVRPARRMPAKRKTEASKPRPKGAHPSPHANSNR